VPKISVFALLLSFLIAPAALAQNEDWLPVTQQDLQLKDVPGDPGASAIQLYYANYIDDNSSSEFIYHRIKILTEKGKKSADVEITIPTGTSIKDLKARTIKPDGSIIDFTDKPFDKTILKGQGIKWLVKSFTMPQAGVGSIIEYKYKEDYGENLTSDTWILQHDLFTVKESFKFKRYQGPFLGYFLEGTQLAWVAQHVSKDQQPTMTKDKNAALELQNMPGFEAEEYMPPENDYKASVRFYYMNPEIKSTDGYWQFLGKRLYEFDEHFMGGNKEANRAATEAIGSEPDPETRLRRLYARAQQIRNLTYERERTAEERKKENLKTNEGVAEILRRGYGDASDIALTFVAMARAAGFDASPLFVSDRKEALFSKDVLAARELDWIIADVKLNGKDIYLDPGTKYCPFGLLRWMRTSTPALRPDKNTPTFVSVPGTAPRQALLHRTVNATIDANGSLKADLVVSFEGMQALEQRLNAVDADEEGKRKQLEDEAKSWLPPEATVKLLDAKGWEDTDQPLVVHFSIDIENYASAVGKRLLFPSYVFLTKRKEAFTHADRKYPIYFSYAFGEMDVVNIRFPSGYTPEGSPNNQDAKLPYAVYQSSSKFESGQLSTQRNLVYAGIYVNVNQYPSLKEFFSKVQAADEQQAVLQAGGAVSAQKGN
jgi:hypothetical protein